jgi:hypothetical protein
MGAIPGARFKPHRAMWGIGLLLSLLLEVGPFSLNLAGLGATDQID